MFNSKYDSYLVHLSEIFDFEKYSYLEMPVRGHVSWCHMHVCVKYWTNSWVVDESQCL